MEFETFTRESFVHNMRIKVPEIEVLIGFAVS
jgi:hypothetical protein